MNDELRSRVLAVAEEASAAYLSVLQRAGVPLQTFVLGSDVETAVRLSRSWSAAADGATRADVFIAALAFVGMTVADALMDLAQDLGE